MIRDIDKTKEQLIGELAQMRQQITELGASEANLKQAERALMNSEEKYHQLIENLQEGVWVIDKEACTSHVPEARYAPYLDFTTSHVP